MFSWWQSWVSNFSLENLTVGCSETGLLLVVFDVGRDLGLGEVDACGHVIGGVHAVVLVSVRAHGVVADHLVPCLLKKNELLYKTCYGLTCELGC